MELQTLIEEDETIDQLPLEQETQYSSSFGYHTQWEDHVTPDTPTQWENLVTPDTPTQWEDHVTPDTPTLQDDQNNEIYSDGNDETLNRNDTRDSLVSDNRASGFNVSYYDNQLYTNNASMAGVFDGNKHDM